MSIHAIHHVTAITAQIGENMKFYTGVLGLRLVKRSVNQDDVSAYHLFYADGVGTPGTDITFFDWPRIPPSIPGSATVGRTTFAVPAGSLDWWEDRLLAAGITPFRGGGVIFQDPEGQNLELIVEDKAARNTVPWTKDIPAENAIRGIVGVELNSARPDRTTRVLVEILGFRGLGNDVFETAGGTHFARLKMSDTPLPMFGQPGAGGVHHVAFRVDDENELMELEDKVRDSGLKTSGVINRYYFKSVYFREPGGILFELATDGPGFGKDEDMATLGEKLALPPFLESQRASIEANLKPLPDM